MLRYRQTQSRVECAYAGSLVACSTGSMILVCQSYHTMLLFIAALYLDMPRLLTQHQLECMPLTCSMADRCVSAQVQGWLTQRTGRPGLLHVGTCSSSMPKGVVFTVYDMTHSCSMSCNRSCCLSVNSSCLLGLLLGEAVPQLADLLEASYVGPCGCR